MDIAENRDTAATSVDMADPLNADTAKDTDTKKKIVGLGQNRCQAMAIWPQETLTALAMKVKVKDIH